MIYVMINVTTMGLFATRKEVDKLRMHTKRHVRNNLYMHAYEGNVHNLYLWVNLVRIYEITNINTVLYR